MKVRNLFLILLLLSSFLLYGCGSSSDTSEYAAMPASEGIAAPQEAAAGEEAAPLEKSSAPLTESFTLEEAKSAQPEGEENVVGVFEYLEDNHTAVFSFDNVEFTFHFEDPAVQEILMEAIVGSSYTLSYNYDDGLGLNIIYEISE